MTISNIPQLRPYQQKGVDEARKLLNQRKRVMLQCPTGGGKTEMAIVLVKEWLARAPETASGPLPPRVLWLTHRAELRRQTGNRFQKYDVPVLDLSELAPRERRLKPGSLCIVAPQVKGIAAFAAQASERDLLIADEAHHAPAETWKRLIQKWPGVVLGLTATPWRLSRKQGFDHLFDELVTGPSVDELVETPRDDGFGLTCLSPYALYSPQGVRVIGGRQKGNDFDVGDIDYKVLGTDDVISAWTTLKPDDARTIWYVPTVKSAEQLHETLKRAGIRAQLIKATTTETEIRERDDALRRFREREVDHVINVMILMEGIDVPEANCIVFARPTMSLVVFLQAMGRGLRPALEKRTVLIDLSASYNNFNVYPFGEISWSLKPRKSQTSGEPPMKPCPNCEALIYTGYHKCPVCGLSLGEECVSCRRLTFYTSAGCGGRSRLCLAILTSALSGSTSSQVASSIEELRSIIDTDGGMKCLDCTDVLNVQFHWESELENEICRISSYEASIQRGRTTIRKDARITWKDPITTIGDIVSTKKRAEMRLRKELSDDRASAQESANPGNDEETSAPIPISSSVSPGLVDVERPNENTIPSDAKTHTRSLGAGQITACATSEKLARESYRSLLEKKTRSANVSDVKTYLRQYYSHRFSKDKDPSSKSIDTLMELLKPTFQWPSRERTTVVELEKAYFGLPDSSEDVPAPSVGSSVAKMEWHIRTDGGAYCRVGVFEATILHNDYLYVIHYRRRGISIHLSRPLSDLSEAKVEAEKWLRPWLT